jgi:putative transposase
VNHKRVARLMHTMGVEAIYPKPRLSQAQPTHRVYPYLLRGVPITRVNQVWSTDITYIRLHGGFLYLVAVMDWFSRYVLSWAVSITMDVGFCLEALDHALEVAQPEIFNSDQGAQFRVSTSPDGWHQRGYKSVWMGEDGHSTTSLSNGCGGPSNMRRSI